MESLETFNVKGNQFEGRIPHLVKELGVRRRELSPIAGSPTIIHPKYITSRELPLNSIGVGVKYNPR